METKEDPPIFTGSDLLKNSKSDNRSFAEPTVFLFGNDMDIAIAPGTGLKIISHDDRQVRLSIGNIAHISVPTVQFLGVKFF